MEEKRNRFSAKARMHSFRYAFSGLRSLVRFEHNFRIHLLAMILSISLGIVVGLSKAEWLLLILLIALVLVAEAFNSALETLADEVTPERNERIGRMKDYGAAAVLIAAVAAVAGGCMLFIPKILDWFS